MNILYKSLILKAVGDDAFQHENQQTEDERNASQHKKKLHKQQGSFF